MEVQLHRGTKILRTSAHFITSSSICNCNEPLIALFLITIMLVIEYVHFIHNNESKQSVFNNQRWTYHNIIYCLAHCHCFQDSYHLARERMTWKFSELNMHESSIWHDFAPKVEEKKSSVLCKFFMTYTRPKNQRPIDRKTLTIVGKPLYSAMRKL